MKLIALTLLATLGFAGPLTDSDRGRILSELHASRKQLLDAVAGLSQAQWTYKAGPDRWSIGETTEHIISAEPFLRNLLTATLKTPADAAKAEQRKPNIAAMDEGLLKGLLDRSKKASAPGEIAPKGRFNTPADAIAAFKAEREKTLDYVRTTTDDLRSHLTSPLPGSEMDCAQLLLMIAGHNERHVLQIEEVKQNPAYAKK